MRRAGDGPAFADVGPPEVSILDFSDQGAAVRRGHGPVAPSASLLRAHMAPFSALTAAIVGPSGRPASSFGRGAAMGGASLTPLVWSEPGDKPEAAADLAALIPPADGGGSEQGTEGDADDGLDEGLPAGCEQGIDDEKDLD